MRVLAMTGAVAVGAALAVTSGLAQQASSAQQASTAQQASSAQQQDFSQVVIDAVKVTDNIYMLVGAGGNVTVQFGSEGVLVVDTSYGPMSGKILTEIKKLSNQPIRYVINTHVHGDHIGGNEPIAKAGRTRAGGNVVGDLGSGATAQAAVIAHENVLNRMSMPAPDRRACLLPPGRPETFIGRKKEMIFNDEAVQIIHEEAAHTDGDSVVMFRRNDVLATGDLFTTVMYPFIDDANGGTINGYVNALNAILDLTVASNVNEGGTMVIPGHGRLSDEQDVIEYRDMVTIVRDRIKEYVHRGMTLEQVKAKKPTLDWDRRYGDGFVKPEAFIEVVYKQLAAEKAAAAPAKPGATKTKGNGK
jgi:glyoxylase-like metal-dependent hydrolase (beta-lactamase superfamily II)